MALRGLFAADFVLSLAVITINNFHTFNILSFMYGVDLLLFIDL